MSVGDKTRSSHLMSLALGVQYGIIAPSTPLENT